jgi:molybdate transport system ATP-binding protein
MLEVDIRRRLGRFHLDTAFSAGDEIAVLFGPSGAGKSLTLQAIAGILRPDKGLVRVNGLTAFDSAAGINLPPQERRIGYVPQGYALFPHLTVAHNIGYGLSDLDRRQRSQRVQEIISLLGLDGLEDRRPRELSGGQQQRVALARALVFRPRLLLLDEPFAALDEAIRSTLREELLDIRRRMAVTIVVVTHDLTEAFALGDRIAVLDSGRVLQQGRREEVYYRPASRRVAELVQSRNILAGRVVESGPEGLRIDWQGRAVKAPACCWAAAGAAVDFCIRASQVMVVRPGRPANPGERFNVFRGRVVREDLGAEGYLIYVRLAGSEQPYDLQIELPIHIYYRLNLDADKDVDVSLNPELIHVMPASAGGGSASG